MHFVTIEAKDFPLYEKNFYTSSLDQAKTLFYLRDSHKLTVDDSMKFVEMVKNSPNKFLLSSDSVSTNWYLKKSCIYKVLQEMQDEITFYLKQLMTEPNRHLVLENLKEADPVHLFHILKFGAWQNLDSLNHLIEVGRNLYKVKKTYLLSMLVLMPPKAYAFRRNEQKEDEMQKNIKKKIKSEMPHMKKSSVADTFLLMKNCHSSLGLDTSPEENTFLGVSQKEKTSTQAEPFLKAVNLSDFI